MDDLTLFSDGWKGTSLYHKAKQWEKGADVAEEDIETEKSRLFEIRDIVKKTEMLAISLRISRGEIVQPFCEELLRRKNSLDEVARVIENRIANKKIQAILNEWQ